MKSRTKIEFITMEESQFEYLVETFYPNDFERTYIQIRENASNLIK